MQYILADRMLNDPITSIKYHSGKLYVANRDKISMIDPNTGMVKDIITGLPANGDHPNIQIAFNPLDNRIYFGEGSATNSGVVGIDNYFEGWLKLSPNFHDIPAKNLCEKSCCSVGNPCTSKMQHSYVIF